MNAGVATATIGKEAYVTELTAGNHTQYADEPVIIGGKDRGPAPGDLLRMSLASCTAITLRMYANRKKFDVHEITVMVSSQQKDGKTVFHRNVKIAGTVDDKQHTRLLQIANACPIHKILTNTVEIETAMSVNPTP